jgi:hypothetical protein
MAFGTGAVQLSRAPLLLDTIPSAPVTRKLRDQFFVLLEIDIVDS